MRYPALSRTRCTEIAQRRVDGFQPSVEHEIDWLGAGDAVDLRDLEKLASDIAAEIVDWTDPDKDRFEGSACGWLFAALSHLPTEVLDDRGFWRYLAIQYFWDFIAWREAKPFSAGNHLKYVDASDPKETVLTRMYLRAQALGGAEAGILGGAIPRAGDFWRSHVIRVKTGTAPPFARAFAQRQSRDRLKTGPIREVAKRLTRLWTNVVPYVYDGPEATELMREVWEAEAPE